MRAVSESGQPEKDRHHRGTAGQPPIAETFTDRPAQPVSAIRGPCATAHTTSQAMRHALLHRPNDPCRERVDGGLPGMVWRVREIEAETGEGELQELDQHAARQLGRDKHVAE